MESTELTKYAGRKVFFAQNIKGGYTEYEDYTLNQCAEKNGKPCFQIDDFQFTADQVTKFRASPASVHIEVIA